MHCIEGQNGKTNAWTNRLESPGLESYISQIDDVTRPDKTYLYRGQENENWQVNSSAYRRLRSVTSHLKEQSDRPFNFLPLLQGYLLQIVNEVRLKYPSTYKATSSAGVHGTSAA